MNPPTDSPAGAGRRFDSQAAEFDERKGLPPTAAAAIADALVGLAADGDGPLVVLELGAGTGDVGRHLGDRASRYVGMDLSRPMLEVFASKLAGGAGNGASLLVQADADVDWPVVDGSVAIVFASRSAHLLAAAHVVDEVRRVCDRPGWFVAGRVERSGIKQALRRQREAMLIERGVAAGRSGLRRTRGLLESFAEVGATAVPNRPVASWTSTTTAEEVIAGWEPMATMAGQPVDVDTRADVLAGLRRWAVEEFGALDAPQGYGEQYTLEGVRLG